MTDTIIRPILVSKIRPKNLGNPKVAAAFSDEEMAAQKIYWLGTILGKASGTKKTVDPKDDTKISWALTGFFEGRPTDPSKPVLRSGICWLPGGIHEMVVAAVQGLPAGEVLPFSYVIGTKRDTNAVGYSYVIDDNGIIKQEDAQDILADLRAASLALPKQSMVEVDTKTKRRAKA
jgi:hypothetical protein